MHEVKVESFECCCSISLGPFLSNVEVSNIRSVLLVQPGNPVLDDANGWACEIIFLLDREPMLMLHWWFVHRETWIALVKFRTDSGSSAALSTRSELTHKQYLFFFEWASDVA